MKLFLLLSKLSTSLFCIHLTVCVTNRKPLEGMLKNCYVFCSFDFHVVLYKEPERKEKKNALENWSRWVLLAVWVYIYVRASMRLYEWGSVCVFLTGVNTMLMYMHLYCYKYSEYIVTWILFLLAVRPLSEQVLGTFSNISAVYLKYLFMSAGWRATDYKVFSVFIISVAVWFTWILLHSSSILEKKNTY